MTGAKSEAADTSFRKTWDRAEYAEKAAVREAKYREEGKARAEAKAQGRRYHDRAGTPPDTKDTESRANRLSVTDNVGKSMLVPAGAVGNSKRGRGAGFYCQECDLTYKDNVQFVEHLNSKQHLVATGQTGEVHRATLDDVRDRLAWLVRKREEEVQGAGDVVELGKRLEARHELDEKEREEKRARRREKRRKTAGGVGVKQEEGVGSGIIC